MSAARRFERRILEVALERLADEPLLLLQGPRTVGKTYLLHQLAARHGGDVIDLDDPPTRDAVRRDASTFIEGPTPVFVDEYQHEPSVLAAIKAELNQDLRPGRFVLAGSTKSTAIPEVAEYLAGRVNLLPVLPLSQGEIAGVREDFSETLLFGEVSSIVTVERSTTSRAEYARRIAAGGMPIALARSEEARNRWFDDYTTLVVERGVLEMSKLRRRRQLPALLRHIASQTGQLLNITSTAQAAALDRHTAADYLNLLESVFLVRQLPAWGRTLGGRTTGTPKVHLVDSGLAARLLRLTPEHLARRDVTALTEFGHLLETFVVGELVKQSTWLSGVTGWHHWRTYDGDEVDLVIERDDGRIVAIEVKGGSRVPGEDMRALERLRDAAGDAFIVGVALYTGERSYNYGDRLYVAPIDRMWIPTR
ncbi:MAG TPA: ATP-binding protein [Acidimicrobiales bacterium]|nr:ATP-binding protein [Acidimicrobiales bacterium]